MGYGVDAYRFERLKETVEELREQVIELKAKVAKLENDVGILQEREAYEESIKMNED